MIEFETREEPVHHITVAQGAERTHFWYFLSAKDSKPFDEVGDGTLVEKLHIEGNKLDLGKCIIVTSQKGHKYTLCRLDAKNYVVQSLSSK